MNKTQKFIVGAGIATAMAFFSYRVYKTYKELERQENEMKEIELELKAKEAERLLAGPKETGLEEYPEELIPEEDENYIEEVYLYEQMEEVEALRYPANSKEALDQYIDMNLAEFDYPSETREKLEHLFKEPIHFRREDEIVMLNIRDARAEFFGEDSVHTEADPTFAELILYYARTADFDLDGGVEEWATQIMNNIDYHPNMGTVLKENVLDSIQNHYYVNSKSAHGIFGLSLDQMHELASPRRGQPTPITFSKQYHMYISEALKGANPS